MPHWLLIPGSSLKPTPWRNGLGTTRDIATHLAPDGALRWQVGIADLVQDAEFSHYPGCDRVFTPIAGNPPPELAFHGGPFEPCPLLSPKPFPGDIATRSRITAPGRAFNIVYNRQHHQAAVSVVRLPAGSSINAPPTPYFFLHCLTGQMTAAETTLNPGDTLRGPDPATPAQATHDTVAILVSISGN